MHNYVKMSGLRAEMDPWNAVLNRHSNTLTQSFANNAKNFATDVATISGVPNRVKKK